MSLAESDALCIQFRDQVLAQRGITGPVNSFTSEKESQKVTLDNGVVIYSDLPYESKYPNAFFDIWYPDATEKKRPTILYFHGGGCLFGDKMEGDPFAVGEASDSTLRKVLAEQGYNIVSANYAFAPEYRFPVQLVQVNELIAYLKKSGEQFGIFMDDVVIMGSSAGANLTELYGLVVSNPDYAAKVGIEPALDMAEIRGLVIDEAALDMKNLKPGIGTMAEGWLGTDDLVNGEPAILANAARHVTEDYPRAFINSSNVDPCFLESAEALKQSLDALGVENIMFYMPSEEAELHHGFMNQFSTNPAAEQCFSKVLKFLSRERD